MRRIILPTFDIVTECEAYDPVFSFLPGGVRDVIRGSVFTHSFEQRRFGQDKNAILRNSIVTEFDRFLDDVRQGDNVGCDYHESLYRSSYLERISEIEFLVSEISQLCDEMMIPLFRTQLIDILTNKSSWRGRDLMITIRGFQ